MKKGITICSIFLLVGSISAEEPQSIVNQISQTHTMSLVQQLEGLRMQALSDLKPPYKRNFETESVIDIEKRLPEIFNKENVHWDSLQQLAYRCFILGEALWIFEEKEEEALEILEFLHERSFEINFPELEVEICESLGSIHYRLKNIENAAKYAKSADEYAYPAALEIMRGVTALVLGNTDHAKQIFFSGCDWKCGESALFLKAMGEIPFITQDNPECPRYLINGSYEEFLADPNNSSYHRAIAFGLIGNYEESLNECAKYMEWGPTGPAYDFLQEDKYVTRGLLHLIGGDPSAALRDFIQAESLAKQYYSTEGNFFAIPKSTLIIEWVKAAFFGGGGIVLQVENSPSIPKFSFWRYLFCAWDREPTLSQPRTFMIQEIMKRRHDLRVEQSQELIQYFETKLLEAEAACQKMLSPRSPKTKDLKKFLRSEQYAFLQLFSSSELLPFSLCYDYGFLLFLGGNYNEALNILEPLWERRYELSRLMMDQEDEAFELDWPKEEHIKISFKDTSDMLATIYFHLGDIDRSIEYLSFSDEKNGREGLLNGIAALIMENKQRAKEIFTKEWRYEPIDALFLKVMGEDPAIGMERNIGISEVSLPEECRLTWFGETYLRRGNYETILSINAAPNPYRAVALAITENYEGALQEYTTLIERDGGGYGRKDYFYNQRGLVYILMGDKEAAQNDFLQAENIEKKCFSKEGDQSIRVAPFLIKYLMVAPTRNSAQ